MPFIRKWSIDDLVVFAKYPSGVTRQSGIGTNEYVRSSCRFSGFSWNCDFNKSVNATSLCSWNCTSFPWEVVSFTFLLAASIVCNFCFFTGSKKKQKKQTNFEPTLNRLMDLFIYLSIYVFIHLFIYLFIYFFIHSLFKVDLHITLQ